MCARNRLRPLRGPIQPGTQSRANAWSSLLFFALLMIARARRGTQRDAESRVRARSTASRSPSSAIRFPPASKCQLAAAVTCGAQNVNSALCGVLFVARYL